MYGSIRIHQERAYPGRAVGTSFINPDLELIGKAYGCSVTHISSRDDLKRIPELIRAPGPQFIVVDSSVEALLPKPATGRL
jgi:acetolactate synthase-1/2/3 large subunit